MLFPGAAAPFAVARERSLAMVDEFGRTEARFVAVFCQRDPGVEKPAAADLQTVGVLARVDEIVPVPGEPTILFTEGLERISLLEVTQTDPYLRARVATRTDGPRDAGVQTLVDDLRRTAAQTIALMSDAPDGAQAMLDRIVQPGDLADAIAANLDAPQDVKGALLAAENLPDRLQKLLDLLKAQLNVLEARKRAVG